MSNGEFEGVWAGSAIGNRFRNLGNPSKKRIGDWVAYWLRDHVQMKCPTSTVELAQFISAEFTEIVLLNGLAVRIKKFSLSADCLRSSVTIP
jgi:hypothetical protein